MSATTGPKKDSPAGTPGTGPPAQHTDGKGKLDRKALDLSNDHVEGILYSALECYTKGDLGRAAEMLKGLVHLAPEDPRPHKLLASTYLLLEQRPEAEEMYGRAYALEPDDPYTLVALAELKLEDMRLEEAVPLFEKLFEMDPEGTHPAAIRGRQIVREYHERMTSP